MQQILMPKHDIISPKRGPVITLPKIGIGGEFKCKLWNADGSLAYESDWSSNIIVNNGLIIYKNSWFQFCCIGSGSTAVDITDTTIETFLAVHDGGITNTTPTGAVTPVNPITPNYERYSSRYYRFNAGTGTGTVREFTLGVPNDGTNIFCRHNLPAPIVKGASQVLDVHYKFIIYPNIGETTGNDVIFGESYDWGASQYNLDLSGGVSTFQPFGWDQVFGSYHRCYDGVKGTPTTDPTGNNQAATNTPYASISSGSGFWEMRFDWILDNFNFSPNFIRVVTQRIAPGMQFQCDFAATTGSDIGGGIPKDATMIGSVTFRLTWARH